MPKKKLFLLCIFLLLNVSMTWGQDTHRVFLIGDAGEPHQPTDPNLQFLDSLLRQASPQDILIFLGDNLYPKGLPDSEHPERKVLEAKLNAQLELIKNFPGKAFMIPGNHDWAQGKNYGWERIREQEKYVTDYLQDDAVFLPKGGCPGPLEIPVSEEITLILMDTQYFLHRWDKPEEDSDCASKSTIQALQQLEEIVIKNAHKHLLVVGHHPIYTYGKHRGSSTLRQHIFPLTDLNKALWIPMPLIGSIYPLYRKYVGDIQDISHPRYQAIRKAITGIFERSRHIVYVSGHEHTLQYIQRADDHYLVSGSGSKKSLVRAGQGTRFQAEERGFMQLTYQPEGIVRLQVWGGDLQKMLFSHTLYQKKVLIPEEVTAENRPNYQDSMVAVRADTRYQAGKFKRLMLGQNYRDVWATPVRVPVFDLEQQRGGLQILKQGGGMQTKSLRLENPEGRQYVLRSVKKYAENAIPELLKKTFAAEIVQDQVSASHPYGAFVIPPLAEAAQIYHTNPKPYLMPRDPLLGQYRYTFSGLLMLHEERPHKENSDEPFFNGGQPAEDIESTTKTLEELREDNDNRVDEPFVVRNRLFDMIIGDWDRHDDQWRFTQFEDPDGKGNLYRPIPRDRDQVFFLNQGIVPWFAARRWALPKVEGFDERMRWAPGFNHNARYFDRTFMTEADWAVWEKEVYHLQESLTDSVIESAIATWPDTIFALTGAHTIHVLKARRDDLLRYAREHYEFLSREVEVVGSDKHEHFLVERLDNERTRVTVRKRKKDGELKQIIYQRTFLRHETREIRLFGLDGQDVFQIEGQVRRGIRVRVIGGKGKDRIEDRSRVSGLSRKTLVYDRLKNTELKSGGETKNRLSKHPEVNHYDRKSFAYDILMPLVSLQFNRDDGLFIGGGFDLTLKAWRRKPYAARHQFLGNLALATASFNGKYSFDIPQIMRKWGLFGIADLQMPFFASNYFGLGNETSWTFEEDESLTEEPIDYYRIRVMQLRLEGGLSRALGQYGNFKLSGIFRQLEVDPQQNRFYASPESDLNLGKVVRPHRYGGLRMQLEWDTRQDPHVPKRGVHFNLQTEQLFGLNRRSENLSRIRSSLSLFFSARLPARLVIATRIGTEHLLDRDFEFFNASTLGGRTSLRGFRRTRFYGQSSLFHNLDLRLKLFSFQSYLFPGTFGVLAFQDMGRVWLHGENSDRWHFGRGFGVWIAPANKAVLTFNLAFTQREETLPSVTLGFFF